ncbi:hypothetical protein AT01_2833 [Yersinia aldovae 670-83]|nr:hypothetical protein AT01_2833 [Yersinia aldovae 670-83]
MCENQIKEKAALAGGLFLCVSDSDDSIMACDKLRMQFEPRLALGETHP